MRKEIKKKKKRNELVQKSHDAAYNRNMFNIGNIKVEQAPLLNVTNDGMFSRADSRTYEESNTTDDGKPENG